MKTSATIFLTSMVAMTQAQNFKSLEEEIIINAPAEAVWNVLVDFENWENWNPFIIKAKGKAEVGEKLENVFRNGDKDMVIKPKLLKVDQNEELVWIGRLIMPGIFDGRHGFRIEEIGPNQVRFVNYENFKGILSGMIMKKIGEDTKANFNKMNQALKAEVEQQMLAKN